MAKGSVPAPRRPSRAAHPPSPGSGYARVRYRTRRVSISEFLSRRRDLGAAPTHSVPAPSPSSLRPAILARARSGSAPTRSDDDFRAGRRATRRTHRMTCIREPRHRVRGSRWRVARSRRCRRASRWYVSRSRRRLRASRWRVARSRRRLRASRRYVSRSRRRLRASRQRIARSRSRSHSLTRSERERPDASYLATHHPCGSSGGRPAGALNCVVLLAALAGNLLAHAAALLA